MPNPSSTAVFPDVNLDWGALVPAIGAANRAVASFDGVLYGLRNPEILLAPLQNQEAVLSSRIEGTQAGLDDVFEIESGGKIRDQSIQADVTEIINYRTCLLHARERIKEKPFCLNTLKELHAILLNSTRGYDKGRGQFRTVQNWIGRTGVPIEQADFVPPPPEQLWNVLGQWETYYHSKERDPLVQLAIVHAQFEVIHPFLDGNGRMGRLLIPLFLYEKHILQQPCFYLSAHLEAHRDDYINHLRELHGEGGWNRWVAFFLQAINQQAHLNATKARAMQDLYETSKERAIKLTRSLYAVHLLDFMFEHPVFQSSDLTQLPGSPSRVTVSQLLSKLKRDGMLEVREKGSGSRPQRLAFSELLGLCKVDRA